MVSVYRFLTQILYPFLIIFTYCRKFINKEHPERYKEKILPTHFNVKKKDKSKLIWFHAASIGEFKSILPLVEKLNTGNNSLKFLITTSTLSSGNLAVEELKKFDNIEHRYFPYDVPFLISKFLTLWKPDKIFLVDSEIWPNLILTAHQKKIPIALINARLTLKSFNRWMMFYRTAKEIFEKFELCLCANNETKNYLNKLNVKKVDFVGNIKLATQIKIDKIDNFNEEFLTKKRFWLAASTHTSEDIFCIKTHLKLKEKFSDIITIIAPRHIERSKKIMSLAKKYSLKTQILNKNEEILSNKEIIIINYFGGLNNLYRHAKSVLIGKSISKEFENDGGQSPIEAAKLNCKIYNGPYVYNFEDIYKIFERKNISKTVQNYEELSKNLSYDLELSNTPKNEFSNLIENLGQKTLSDTMNIINKFL